MFHVPDWLHHLLMTGRILFKNTLEAYTDYYLQHKLDQVVQEHRLVSLITLLRGNLGTPGSPPSPSEPVNLSILTAIVSTPHPDAVFCESSPSRSSHDRQRRAKKTFEEMMSYIPGMYSLAFHRRRCRFILFWPQREVRVSADRRRGFKSDVCV